MYRIFLLAILLSITLACTKDRFPPLEPGGEPGTESTIYFWDFNDGNTQSISAPIVSVGDAQMTYSGVFDYSDGTTLNAMEGTSAGSCLRLRNPAGSYIIKINTLGFEKLKMSYAVMRTNNGAQENRISYSIDGVNYFQNGVAEASTSVGLEFELKEFDLSAINSLNNQNLVFIKIDFNLGHDNPTGNNRFDNFMFRATNL